MTRAMRIALAVAAVCLLASVLGRRIAVGHCDTMDGPVIADAKAALEKGDVAGVLKWVHEDKEAEVRQAFQKAMAVRSKGPEARELADAYFFETLVRVHREGEGAPYTGIKPVGTPLEAGVAESDKALETGSADALVKAATGAVAEGIRHRFAEAAEARRHANESVQAGRKYVAAYVEYVHYVERIFADAKGSAHAHGEEGKAATQAAHHHPEPTQAPAQTGAHQH